MLRAALLACLVLALGAADQVALELPKTWRGKKDSTEGNPAAAKGMPPLWRFDALWPADPQDGKAYAPMIWEAQREQWYRKEHSHGGYPAAKLADDRSIVLGVCAPWPGQEGHKLPALVFIAPTGATYAVAADVSVQRHAGSGDFTLGVWRRETDKKSLRMVEVKQEKLAVGKTTKLEFTAELGAAQELCLVPKASLDNTAGNVVLANLQVVVRR